MSSKSTLITDSNLQMFFFEHLRRFNQKFSHPLAEETLFYSSHVMDQFGHSSKFFDQKDNRIQEKVLGLKLLEISELPKEKQKYELKDIAETSLLLCGFFAESLNRKIIDIHYYENIGKKAYEQLNHFYPNHYDVPAFYKMMALKFRDVTMLMKLVANECDHNSDREKAWLII